MGFSLPDRLTFDQKSKPILPAEPPAFLFGPAERLEGAQLGVWSGPFSDPILHQNPSISDLFWTIFGPLLDHFRIRFSIRIHRFRIIFGPLLDHFRSRFSIRIHRFRIIFGPFLDHFRIRLPIRIHRFRVPDLHWPVPDFPCLELPGSPKG